MDAESVLIPLAGMALVAGLLALVTNVIGQWIVNRTMREALKSSPENLALVADKLAARRPWNLENWGLISMAVGAALAVAGLIGDPASRTVLLQTALLPGFVGAALFGQRWLPKRSDVQAIEHAPAE